MTCNQKNVGVIFYARRGDHAPTLKTLVSHGTFVVDRVSRACATRISQGWAASCSRTIRDAAPGSCALAGHAHDSTDYCPQSRFLQRRG